jgi:hypothetical protein
MPKPSQAHSTPQFSSSDVKLAACALAAGGKLRAAEPDSSGRLCFAFDGIDESFQFRVENGEVVLPARDFIRAMESVLRMVSQHQRTPRR